MFGKKKWYQAAWKAYRKNKLTEPYRTLLRYYILVGYGTPIARFEGHYEYFMLEKWDGSIERATENLRSVLPDALFENYCSALEAFSSLGKEPEYEKVMTVFEKQDEYVFDHCGEIAGLLSSYVTEMTAKKVF